MRKQLSSKELEIKKEKRNQRILGIVLIFVMFGSVFGVVVSFFSSNEPESLEDNSYKGYDLINQNGLYILKIGEKYIYLTYNPNDLASIEYDANMTKLVHTYLNEPLYIDTSNQYIYQSIGQNLFEYPLRISSACIDELDCADENYPIKTCEENMIIIRESNENKIYENENCIFIDAKKEDMQSMADIFLLKSFGIN